MTIHNVVLSSALVSLEVTDHPVLNLPSQGFTEDPVSLSQDADTGELIATAFGTATKLLAVKIVTLTLSIKKGEYLESWIKYQQTSNLLGAIIFKTDFLPSNIIYKLDNCVIKNINYSLNGKDAQGTVTIHGAELVNTGILGG